jgi:hypothetical protein
METREYTSLILTLAKYTRNVANAQSKMIGVVSVPVLKTKIEGFHQMDDGTPSGYTTEFEQMTKTEPSADDVINKILSKVKEEVSYKEAVDLVCEKLNVQNGQADFWISNFLDQVALQSLNGASEDGIAELAVRFIMELEGTPRYWTPINLG